MFHARVLARSADQIYCRKETLHLIIRKNIRLNGRCQILLSQRKLYFFCDNGDNVGLGCGESYMYTVVYVHINCDGPVSL